MPIAVQQILNTLNTFDRVLYNVFYRVLRFTQGAFKRHPLTETSLSTVSQAGPGFYGMCHTRARRLHKQE